MLKGFAWLWLCQVMVGLRQDATRAFRQVEPQPATYGSVTVTRVDGRPKLTLLRPDVSLSLPRSGFTAELELFGPRAAQFTCEAQFRRDIPRAKSSHLLLSVAVERDAPHVFPFSPLAP